MVKYHRREGWQPGRLLWVILVLALLLRIGGVVILGVPDVVWSSEYGSIASQVVQGNGYVFDFYGLRPSQPLRSFMPPLYTLILAGALWLFPAPGFALGLVQAGLSAATCYLMYRTGALLWDQRVGLLAAGAFAIYPVYIIQSARALPLTLNVFLLTGLIYLVLSMKEGRRLGWRAAGAGLFLGLSSLSRPVFLGLGGGILLWLWANRKRLPDVSAETGFRWWQPGLMCIAVAGLVLAPWMVRNWTVHQRFVPVSTNGGLTFWNGNNPFTTGHGFDVYLDRLEAYTGRPVVNPTDGGRIVMLKPYPLPRGLEGRVTSLDEVALDRALYAAGLEFIQNHPERWGSLFLTKVRSLWWFRPNVGDNRVFYADAWVWPYRILYTGVLLLACGGVAVSLSRWRGHVILYYLFVYLTVVYAAFNVLTKYRWEMEQFMLLLGAAGGVALADGLGPWLNPRAKGAKP